MPMELTPKRVTLLELVKNARSVLICVVLLISVSGSVAAEEFPQSEKAPNVIGKYDSVTESHANASLLLKSGGSLVIEYWESFGGEISRGTTSGTWEQNGSKITVSYKGITEKLLFEKCTEFTFGRHGCGPGLKLVMPPEPKSTLVTFGPFWDFSEVDEE